ncbi:hypothetical protein ACIP79_14895 [Streptomyces sp. NPDC088747]
MTPASELVQYEHKEFDLNRKQMNVDPSLPAAESAVLVLFRWMWGMPA